MSAGQIIPRRRLLLGGAHEVLDVVEVNVAELAPQVGSGLRSKSRWPLSRRSSIHFGSFLSREILATISGVRPRWAEAPRDISIGPAPLIVTEGSQMLILCSGRCRPVG